MAGQQLHKNTFNEGLDKDTHIKYLKESRYRDASDILLNSDGKFFAATNIRGTTQLEQITNGTLFGGLNDAGNAPASGREIIERQNVMSAIYSRWKVDGTVRDCIVIWTLEERIATNYYNIYLYVIATDTLYTIYTKTDPLDEAFEFFGVSTVDGATDTITGATHPFSTGDEVLYSNPNAGASFGISVNTYYYVNVISPTSISLHTTYAEALLDFNRVNLSSPAGAVNYYLSNSNQGTGTIGIIAQQFPSVDAVVYVDGDTESIYFTDGITPIGKLVCELTTSPANYPFDEREISLRRKNHAGSQAVSKAVDTDARLLCGKYRTTFRLLNPLKKIYSTWSPLSEEVSFYFKTESGGGAVLSSGAVGAISNEGRSLDVAITLSASEYDEYTHYQVGFVEMVDGSPLQPTILKTKSINTLSSASVTYSITDNTYYGIEPVSEVVVEDAAISSASTLTTKENRLVLGDIDYSPLEYDNGNPIIVANEQTFTPNVHISGTLITIVSHGYTTGQAVVLSYPVTDTNITVGGNTLTNNQVYYVRSVDVDTITLHVSKANALSNTSPLTISTTSANTVTLSNTGGIEAGAEIRADVYRRGYFRGEVYRFYIAYYDQFGNYSRPKVLDLNTALNNNISGAIKDFKFVARNSHAGSIFNYSTALPTPTTWGLHLSVDNHPTWARGFTIFRAERLKDVLFQSPLVEASFHQNSLASGSYPQQAFGESTADDTRQIADTEGTVLPKNFMLVGNRQYIRAGATKVGEVRIALSTISSRDIRYVFPPSYMYSYGGLPSLDRPYTFAKGQSLDVVDWVALKASQTVYSTPPATENEGDYIGTVTDTTFYADAPDDYWYYRIDTITGFPYAASVETYSDIVIDDYIELAEGSQTGGVSRRGRISNYNSLRETNLINGVTPTSGKMAAIVLNDQGATGFQEDAAYRGYSAATTGATTGIYTKIRTGVRTTWAGISNTLLTPATSNEFFNNNSPTGYVGAVWIGNIKAGLSDDRYGADDAVHTLVNTGTSYHFTDTEYDDYVRKGLSLPIDNQVWGGDCYVAPATFKLTNGTFSLVNPNKGAAPYNADATRNLQWGKTFDDGAGATRAVAALVPLNGVSTLLSVYLESEVNPIWGEKGNYTQTIVSTFGNEQNFYKGSTESEVKQGYDYGYNAGYSVEDKLKQLLPFSTNENTNNSFPSRIVYSDNKIIGDPILEGFDRIRAANFYDLNGSYGPISKLLVVVDELYCVQRDAFSIIPVGENIVEQTDGNLMAIRSGVFINTPRYLSTKYGTSFQRSVSSGKDMFFFVDTINKCVVMVEGGSYKVVSNNGVATLMESLFSSANTANIKPTNLLTHFDTVDNMLYITNNTEGQDWCYGYNAILDAWVGKFSYNTSNVSFDNIAKGFVEVNGDMYVIGGTTLSNNISTYLYSAKTGAYGNFFGNVIDSFLEMVVNPANDFVKVFDNIVISATGDSGGRLGTLDLNTYRDVSLSNQTVSNQILDSAPREDMHRFKLLRDGSGARLRGSYMTAKIEWDNSVYNQAVPTAHVITKYRLSHRVI